MAGTGLVTAVDTVPVLAPTLLQQRVTSDQALRGRAVLGGPAFARRRRQACQRGSGVTGRALRIAVHAPPPVVAYAAMPRHVSNTCSILRPRVRHHKAYVGGTEKDHALATTLRGLEIYGTLIN